MRKSKINFTCACLLFVTCVFSCATPVAAQAIPAPPNIADGESNSNDEVNLVAKQQIAGVLTTQTKAWNDGDLKNFMQTYWKSDQLTFSGGGQTTRGWQATLERYQKNYSPPKQMGKLNFDELETTLLSTKSALVLGRWHLSLADDQHRHGNFTLIFRNIDGQWKIIHDHSSEQKTDTKPAVVD